MKPNYSGLRSLVIALLLGVLAIRPSPVQAATNGFRGVNWADQRDNFVNDNLVLGGLSTSDSYATTQSKANAILSGFQNNLGANTVRMPVNYPTVSGSYWSSYIGAIDMASSKGMNVILSYWEAASSEDGKVDNLTQFWSMWQTIVTKYGSNSHIYFEPMNEPHGYSDADWKNLAAQWITTYSSVPKGRIIISGSGYNQNGTTIGSDSRFNGCLISIHIYAFWHTNWTTEQQWKDALSSSIGSYASRSLITEFGAPMTTGLNYNIGENNINGNYFIAFMYGVPNRARELGIGTVYWPGLRIGDTYSMETLHGTGINLSLTNNNASGRVQLRWSWGL